MAAVQNIFSDDYRKIPHDKLLSEAAVSDDQGLKLWADACALLNKKSNKKQREGMAILEQSAKAGCLVAMDYLASRLRAGLMAAPRNRAKALEWYIKSAELGSVVAMERCFELFLGDRATMPRDLNRAHHWLGQAISSGSALGKSYSALYEKGPEALSELTTISPEDLVELALEGKETQLYRKLAAEVMVAVETPHVRPDEKALYGSHAIQDYLAAQGLEDDGNAALALILGRLYFGEMMHVVLEGDFDLSQLCECVTAPELLVAAADFLKHNTDFELVWQYANRAASLATEQRRSILLYLSAVMLLESEVFESDDDQSGSEADQRRCVESALGWLRTGAAWGDHDCQYLLAETCLDLSYLFDASTDEDTSARLTEGFAALRSLLADKDTSAANLLLMWDYPTVENIIDRAGADELYGLAFDLIPDLEAEVPSATTVPEDVLQRAFALIPILKVLIGYGNSLLLGDRDDVERGVALITEAITRAEAEIEPITPAIAEGRLCLARHYLWLENLTESIAVLRPMAKSDDAEAIGLLGRCLVRTGDKARVKEGKLLLEKAVQHQDIESLFFVGTRLVHGGEPFCHNVKGGLKLLSEAADQDCIEAAWLLSSLYEGNEDIVRDEALVKKYREQTSAYCENNILNMTAIAEAFSGLTPGVEKNGGRAGGSLRLAYDRKRGRL